MKVQVYFVPKAELEEKIQQEKDFGKRILALSPSKIVRGEVTIYCLAVGL